MILRFCGKTCLGLLVCLGILNVPVRGVAQYTQWFEVDCSNPAAQYPTINSALAVATNGSYVHVLPGATCTEDVTVSNLTNVALATDWRQTAALSGNLKIQSSRSVWIQGLVVSNPAGDGINIGSSNDVTLEFVASIKNSGAGVNIGDASSVAIIDSGTFNDNGARGINIGGNSYLAMLGWGYPSGVIDISNNKNAGINADRSVVENLGNTTITANKADASGTVPNGFGIAEFGGAKSFFGAFFGPITIASNENGGVAIEESSEMSLAANLSWATYGAILQGNGPLGILAEFGSQLTIIGSQVADHTNAGVVLYGNSQAAIYSNDQIIHNGYGSEPGRAGIRVESGSQAYVRNASILNNGGPGILGDLHATLDVTGSTLASNAGGAIACDSSTALATDLTSSALGAANSCKVAGISRIQHGNAMNWNVPDWHAAKARAAKMHKMAAHR